MCARCPAAAAATATRVVHWKRWLAGLLLMAMWLPATKTGAGVDVSGHYVVASVPAKNGATVAEATYGGTAEVTVRRNAVGVTWHLTTQTRKLRGLGFVDGGDVLGVSLATGGIAYGVAIYHHAPGDHQWTGRWTTSIDGGGSPGDISFDDNGNGQLPGGHTLRCHRPGAGSFEGAVTITPSGADFLLTFTTNGALLYRGVGILVDDRLVVGWSFGSAPAVAAYRIGADGLFSGRRFSVRGGQRVETTEALARAGDDAARLLPPAARIDPALVPSDVDAGMEPDAPEVKTLVYTDLMDRYGSDGWAERWLEGQLTPEEHALLEQAVHRRRRSPRDKLPARATIGEIIEQERHRNDD